MRLQSSAGTASAREGKLPPIVFQIKQSDIGAPGMEGLCSCACWNFGTSTAGAVVHMQFSLQPKVSRPGFAHGESTHERTAGMAMGLIIYVLHGARNLSPGLGLKPQKNRPRLQFTTTHGSSSMRIGLIWPWLAPCSFGHMETNFVSRRCQLLEREPHSCDRQLGELLSLHQGFKLRAAQGKWHGNV